MKLLVALTAILAVSSAISIDLGGIGGAIGGVVGGVLELVSGLLKSLGGILGQILNVGSGSGGPLDNATKDILGQLIGVVKNLVNVLIGAKKETVEILGDALKDFTNVLGGLVSGLLSGAITLIDFLFKLLATVNKLIAAITNIINKFGDVLGGGLGNALKVLKDIVDKLRSLLLDNILKALTDLIEQLVKNSEGSVKDIAGKIDDNIKQILAALAKLSNAVDGGDNKVKEAVDELVKNAVDALIALVNKTKDNPDKTDLKGLLKDLLAIVDKVLSDLMMVKNNLGDASGILGISIDAFTSISINLKAIDLKLGTGGSA